MRNRKNPLRRFFIKFFLFFHTKTIPSDHLLHYFAYFILFLISPIWDKLYSLLQDRKSCIIIWFIANYKFIMNSKGKHLYIFIVLKYYYNDFLNKSLIIYKYNRLKIFCGKWFNTFSISKDFRRFRKSFAS